MKLEERYDLLEKMLSDAKTQEMIEENKMEFLGMYLNEWINVSRKLKTDNKKLKSYKKMADEEIDKANNNMELGYNQVTSLLRGLRKEKERVKELELLLEERKVVIKNSFHTPGSGRKLHRQTIRAILIAFKNNEKSEFIKNNKNVSRATFYNVVGRKFKSEKYNNEIDEIAQELGVTLPERD